MSAAAALSAALAAAPLATATARFRSASLPTTRREALSVGRRGVEAHNWLARPARWVGGSTVVWRGRVLAGAPRHEATPYNVGFWDGGEGAEPTATAARPHARRLTHTWTEL